MKKFKNKINSKITFNIWVFVTIIGLLFNSSIDALGANQMHGMVAKKVAELDQKNVFNKEYRIFSVAQSSESETLRETVRNFTLLSLKPEVADIINQKPDYIKLIVPINNRASNFTLLLYKINISPSGLTILTSDGNPPAPDNSIVHYRGIIENDTKSIVAISFSSNDVMGMISNADGNYVLGKIEHNSENLYMVYNDQDLVPPFTFDCATDTSVPQGYPQRDVPTTTLSTNCVNWYWETDYDIFVGKGSVANVNTYVQGIFNQVSTLYANDGMNITLLTVFIWSTVDPYTGPSTSNYLTQFGTNRTSFNGDLATLLGYAGGGGVAWLNGFCSSTSHRMGYTGISSSYNSVPTYSWTVEVVAHEEGHLFGSHHTHDCVWNGNNTKIDACGDDAGYPSGSCALTNPVLPVGGGTIMSYCHLTSAGIKFNLGFGPQPAALMLNNEETSSCLSECSGCITPAQPATISGPTSVCQGAVQNYSVTAVAGATSYTWALPSGWTGASNTNLITVTAGTAGGSISVTANSACGNSTARTLAVTITNLPAQPGVITGNATVCQNTSQIYSVSTVSGATSYTWTLPSGWSGTSNTNTISTVAGSAVGNISVKANNACGSSIIRNLAIVVNAVPASTGLINITGGRDKVCPGDARNYSVASISGLTYNWVVPTGATISNGQGTNAISVIFNSAFTTAGAISVTAANNCGTGPATDILVKRKIPSMPGVINGSVSVCNGSVTTYSISAVSSALSYIWTVPAGAVIQGAQTGRSISVLWGSTGGNISVRAHNNCADSDPRTLAIAVSCRQSQDSYSEKLNPQVFPNPSTGIVTVKFASEKEALYTISVRDVTGRILKSEKYTSRVGENLKTLDLSNFTKGIYFISIESLYTKQLLKISLQ